MATLEEMKTAVKCGTTKVLTLERAKALIGKRIATIFFDFKPQHKHQVDEFTVGEIKTVFDLHSDQKAIVMEFKDKPHIIRKMKSTWEIITEEVGRTFLRAECYTGGIFTGPDIDFEVWYKEV